MKSRIGRYVRWNFNSRASELQRCPPDTQARHFAKGKNDPAFRTKLAIGADCAYGDQDGFRSELAEAGLPFVMALKPRRGTWAYNPGHGRSAIAPLDARGQRREALDGTLRISPGLSAIVGSWHVACPAGRSYDDGVSAVVRGRLFGILVTGAAMIAGLAIAAPGAPAIAAAGAPGAMSYFDLARKDGVGTAAATGSKVWYTVADGVLSDVYEPTIDNTDVSTLQYIVSDGATFADPQTRDMTYTVAADPTGMACTCTPGSTHTSTATAEAGARTPAPTQAWWAPQAAHRSR